MFGAHGLHLHALSLGIDDRSVQPDTERKQVSNEFTFDVDEGDMAEAERVLLALSDKVAGRLNRKGYRGRCVTLKLRDHTFKTVTRSRTLDHTLMAAEDIYREARDLFRREKMEGRKVRLIGVGVSSFDEDGQTSLFEPESKRRDAMEKTIADIRNRFGKNAITRASLVGGKAVKLKPPDPTGRHGSSS
jgi:nucleotidyltransferase/DNA polymerase involved in DNA repair